MAGNATQTIEIEEAGINFTMPSGMVMADRSMVRDHLLSHSRAVERAAIDAHGQAVADIQEMNEKKQGVPPEVLKAMSCVAFKDAIAMRKEEQDGGKSEGEVNGDGVDKHVDSDSSVSSTGSGSVATSCCAEGACAAPRARSIFGLQVDNEEEDRACEICQSGYSEDDEVLPLPCKHFFHKDCITKWFAMRRTCPMCRHPVVPLDEDEEDERQGVIVRRTTTIEWVPVVRWLPASSTTVEVRNLEGTEMETVTTTTTRNTSIDTSTSQALAALISGASNNNYGAAPGPAAAGTGAAAADPPMFDPLLALASGNNIINISNNSNDNSNAPNMSPSANPPGPATSPQGGTGMPVAPVGNSTGMSPPPVGVGSAAGGVSAPGAIMAGQHPPQHRTPPGNRFTLLNEGAPPRTVHSPSHTFGPASALSQIQNGMPPMQLAQDGQPPQMGEVWEEREVSRRVRIHEGGSSTPWMGVPPRGPFYHHGHAPRVRNHVPLDSSTNHRTMSQASFEALSSNVSTQHRFVSVQLARGGRVINANSPLLSSVASVSPPMLPNGPSILQSAPPPLNIAHHWD